MWRKLSNRELADLLAAWENPRVDTAKYFQCAMAAWQVSRGDYEAQKIWGSLCQEIEGKYYVGY